MPTTVDFVGKSMAATLTVTNLSQEQTTIQLRVFRWTQPGGRDRYEPSQEISISPPIVTVGPGEAQLVRLVREDASGGGERAYRVAIDELPSGGPSQTGLRMAVQMLIPVFVNVAPDAVPDLRWSASTQGGLTLRAVNDGGRRVRIDDLSVSSRNGRRIADLKGLVGYALAGQEFRVTVPVPRSQLGSLGEVAIRANSDKGPLSGTATTSSTQ